MDSTCLAFMSTTTAVTEILCRLLALFAYIWSAIRNLRLESGRSNALTKTLVSKTPRNYPPPKRLGELRMNRFYFWKHSYRSDAALR